MVNRMKNRYWMGILLGWLLAALPVWGQDVKGRVEVDYNNPQKYIIGGVRVEGNKHVDAERIISLTGMQKGMELTVPGDAISSMVARLWAQRYFEDVAIAVDSLSAQRDSAWFVILIKERPRVSAWTFTGVKSGEKKELMDRLKLRRGGEYSDYVAKTSVDIIKRFYAEKGFLECKVTPEQKRDTMIKSAIRVNFAVDRGEKIKIKTINFIGNEHVTDWKLAKSMKKTKSAKFYNFFSSKKFNEKEFENDKRGLVSAFNEAGYRDARLVRDSIYYVKPNKLGIDLVLAEGDKYYFRNISWTPTMWSPWRNACTAAENRPITTCPNSTGTTVTFSLA